MKTLIFCTSFLDNQNVNNSWIRYKRWIDFYTPKMPLLGCDTMFLLDDASPLNYIEDLGKVINPFAMDDDIDKINLVRFKNHLGRPSQRDYKGWWRSFSFAVKLAEKYGFQKIIHIESDFFITSSRMLDFIKQIDKGWVTFFSKFHNFPESAIQIICEDEFPSYKILYEEILKKQYSPGISAELALPFTKIIHDFTGDRLGQLDVFEGWLELISLPLKVDYLGQILPKFRPQDFEPFFEIELKWS